MFSRTKDLVVDFLSDHEGILATLAVILIIGLTLGLAVGIIYITGFIAMTIYNAAAPADWPRFSAWIWAGGIWILKSIFSTTVKVSKRDD